MKNLKEQLTETKAQIKELEERLNQLVKTQEGLEEELEEAEVSVNEEKKKLLPWAFNPDILADYPEPSVRDLSPLSKWEDYDQIMSTISEELDLDYLTDYDIAFLFGHYMANHLFNIVHDGDWPEGEEEENYISTYEEYNTYFQMAVTFLFGLKIIMENVIKEEGVLKGFQRALKDFNKGKKNSFELLGCEDTTKLLTAITTMEEPYTLKLELATASSSNSTPPVPKATPKKKTGNQNSKCSLDGVMDSLEELVKNRLGI